MKKPALFSMRSAIAVVLLPILQSCTVAAPNYTLKDLGTQYKVDWVGNSFPATKIISNDDRQHVQQEIEDIFVKPDGTIYSNAVWDERFAQASVYRDGQQIAIMDRMLGHGVKGGYAVTAKGKDVYVAAQIKNIGRSRLNKKGKPVYPEANQTWYGVRLYHSKTGKMAAFSDGYGAEANFLVVNTNGGHIKGLAIQQQKLYVSDTPNNQIKVYDLNNLTQQPILTWSVNRPAQLAFDLEGQLWVVQDNTNRLLRFSPDGKALTQQITLPESAIASDLAISPQGDLLVTDIGSEQNIKIYTNINTQPTLKSTFGQPGGIFANSGGQFTPQAFYKPKGIGVDQQGNIYVAQDAWSAIAGGGTIIQSYQPDGQLRWQIQSLEFMSGLDLDPRHEQWLYSKERLYKFDPTQQSGKTASYHATTLDPVKFPNDPRLHKHFTGVHLHYINDRPLLFMRDRNAGAMAVYRFDPQTQGATAIPYAMFSSLTENWFPQPIGNQEGDKVWLDNNLDGQLETAEINLKPNPNSKQLKTTDYYIEPNGNIWTVTQDAIRQLPVTGYQQNYPLWDLNQAQEFPIPETFTEVRRLSYDRETDTMYLTGYTTDAPYTGEWKAIGKKMARFNNWSTQPTLAWMIDTPWYYENDSTREKPLAIAIAGDYIFIGLGSTGKSQDLDKQSTVFVYHRDNGKYIGSMQHSDQVGPIMFDKATGLNVRKTNNGNYLIFLEDAAFARSIIFHWTPPQ